MSMLDKFKKPEEFDSKDITVIIGDVGAGKTTLVGTFPKPLYMISVGDDDGDEVLQEQEGVLVYRTRAKKIKDKGEKLKKSMDNLDNVLDELIDKISKDEVDVATVGIDAISTVEGEYVEYLTNQKGHNLSFAEWSKIGERINTIYDKVVLLADLGVKIALTSHTKSKEFKSILSGSEYDKIIPLMTVNNGNTITQHARNVWYIENVRKENLSGKLETVRRTTMAGHPFIDVKTRYKGKKIKSKYIDDLTYDKYLEFVKSLDEKDNKTKKKTVKKQEPKESKDDAKKTKKKAPFS